MGRSIDLYSYDYEKLTNKVLQICQTEDRPLVEKILLAGGNKIGDRYVILHQELWEDYNCYFNVARVLEKIFKVDDVFGKVFCTFDDEETNKQELIQAREVYEIKEAIGIEFPDDEES